MVVIVGVAVAVAAPVAVLFVVISPASAATAITGCHHRGRSTLNGVAAGWYNPDRSSRPATPGRDSLAELQPTEAGEFEVSERMVCEGFVSTSTRW